MLVLTEKTVRGFPKALLAKVERFVYVGRPRTFKGFREEAGGMHLGNGTWALRFRRPGPPGAEDGDGA